MSDEKLTQDRRLVRLATKLGDGNSAPLIVESFSATEAMSQGFCLVLNVISNEHTIETKDLVGTPATVSLVKTDESLRHFNGYVHSLECLGVNRIGTRSEYRLTISSWLEVMLSKRSDCRIFQNKSIDNIIDSVFESYAGIAMYQLDIKTDLPIRRYWVQYNETDLEFFNRICYQEGLAYYFSHDNGVHTLHVVDNPEGLNLPRQQVQFQAETSAHDHLSDWQRVGNFTTGHYTQRTYNYMSPSDELEVDSEVITDIKDVPHVKDMKSYRYSEAYHGVADGKIDIQNRARQGSVYSQLRTGSGNCRHLMVGQKMSLALATGGDFADKGKEFNVTKMHLFADDSYGTVHCSIEALPSDEIVYPSSVSPVINSLQTAVVTGPIGKKVHSDSLGRVKVQFHWDRLGKGDEDTTCWLRVMQSFAGSKFGAHFTPRIGQEVVVAFENGNPNRPFVMGALYHPEHTPPYGDQKGTRSGIRTRSINASSPSSCNELYFEDETGNEEVYIQAEKDLNTLVKNDEDRKVQHDQTLAITNNKNEKVGNNSSLKVGKQLTIEAGDSITIKVGGSEIKLTGSSISIKSSVVEINGSQVKIN
jgi:type VI secretion system secreted protein VgrG